MVWGLEFKDHGGLTGPEWANRFVLASYLGGFPKTELVSGQEQFSDGIHFLGPLAKKVIRISPPLVIQPQQARDATLLMYQAAQSLMTDGPNRC